MDLKLKELKPVKPFLTHDNAHFRDFSKWAIEMGIKEFFVYRNEGRRQGGIGIEFDFKEKKRYLFFQENFISLIDPTAYVDYYEQYGRKQNDQIRSYTSIIDVIQELEKEEKFKLVLVSSGDSVIKVIKQIRNLTGVGLREAKAQVDYPPSTIMRNLSASEVEKLKKDFESIGASCEIR